MVSAIICIKKIAGLEEVDSQIIEIFQKINLENTTKIISFEY